MVELGKARKAEFGGVRIIKKDYTSSS